MYIVFNTLNSGLGNNGGSRTLILCAKTIEKLGHRCDIIATDDNFTWFEHKEPIKYIPHDADVIIATAWTTVKSTLESSIKKKAWFIRGHETWSQKERVLSDLYNSGLFNITNSIGLKNKVESFGATAFVVRQGIDTDMWEDLNLRKEKIRIGCLYQKKPTKRWSEFVELAKLLGTDDYEFVAFGDTPRKDAFLSQYICNASSEELKYLYSSCHIWFSPSILEGLSNVPMEAMLCGCLLVGNDNPMNGMINDYLFDGKSGMVYPSGNVEFAANLIKNADFNLTNQGRMLILDSIGNRESNMIKLINILEQI
jgi:glycosyltransferase involved in cell wall biosynthesis